MVVEGESQIIISPIINDISQYGIKLNPRPYNASVSSISKTDDKLSFNLICNCLNLDPLLCDFGLEFQTYQLLFRPVK